VSKLRKYKAAMTALYMTFTLTILLIAATLYAGVLEETVGSIVTLWLTGSGGALAIFVSGNVAVHMAKAKNGGSE